jgi:flagellin-like protein
MELRELLTDDDAVSPVVGVILLVAITVVLAAGTASFVLGLGERTPQPAPQVSFDIEYQQAGNGNLTFIHDGGDNLEPDQISITADRDFHPAPGNDTGDLDGSAYRSLGLDSTVDDPTGGTQQWVSGEIQAGTGATVVGTSSSDDLSGATVRVVFESDDGDRTTTLVEWEGPDA